MKKIRYYMFVIRWMWLNRTWENTRQKWKAMDRAWREHKRTLWAE